MGRGVSALAAVSTRRTARSVEGSVPTTSAFTVSRFEKLTVTSCGVADDVVVRDDVAALVDDEAGAERRLLRDARKLPPPGTRLGVADVELSVALMRTTPDAARS